MLSTFKSHFLILSLGILFKSCLIVPEFVASSYCLLSEVFNLPLFNSAVPWSYLEENDQEEVEVKNDVHKKDWCPPNAQFCLKIDEAQNQNAIKSKNDSSEDF